MAWRIDEHVIRGEIDNRTRGKVTGRIWFTGSDEPVVLELEGNPWRDLAGHLLRFSNPTPKPGLREGFAPLQDGVVGDITASRKVKVPDVPMEEVIACYEKKQPFPWHWGNSLYLEWFSMKNGRVVIETADFKLDLDDTAVWTMSDEEEIEQRRANGEAMTGFMDRMMMAVAEQSGHDDDDAPKSKAEAEADAEAARMDLLLDRVQARIEREGHDDFERIFDEERTRLMRERGESDPQLTPEQEAERQRWIEEMNAICAESVENADADDWKDDQRHPLIERCVELAVRLHHEVGEWLPKDAPQEHPLLEVINGVQSASAKLGGALESADEWPPDKLFAGDVLVRLKKAREWLRDALHGIDAADHESLATPVWRAFVRKETGEILGEVEGLIAEVREVLAEEG
ncbi:hypothetical protein OKA05_20375 [Luteolibacter arcticus]|uniref:Uncharacterized protein n=1 Tax=Luteolibacter arcticus TaxID=1581411 RepID=A0ABT3GN41_9BACT|nr:hypothetical protein [Luteolibacter arcticus]MCW1924930.1 hypothetical protein [Luteolibacter arcticus]